MKLSLRYDLFVADSEDNWVFEREFYDKADALNSILEYDIYDEKNDCYTNKKFKIEEILVKEPY